MLDVARRLSSEETSINRNFPKWDGSARTDDSEDGCRKRDRPQRLACRTQMIGALDLIFNAAALRPNFSARWTSAELGSGPADNITRVWEMTIQEEASEPPPPVGCFG